MMYISSDDLVEFMNEFLLSYVHNPPSMEDITFGYGAARQVVTGQGTVTAELTYDGMNRLVEMHKRTLEEAAIRSKNEAVQHAYEQYQILLKLAQ